MMTDTSGGDKTECNSDTREEFDTNDSPANENKKCRVMQSRRDIFSYLEICQHTKINIVNIKYLQNVALKNSERQKMPFAWL